MPSIGWIIGTIVLLIIFIIGAFFCGILYRKKISEREISSAEEEAKRIINESIKSAESKKERLFLRQRKKYTKAVPSTSVR